MGRGPVLGDVTGDGYDDLVLASFDLPKRASDPSVGSSSLHFIEGGPLGLAARESRAPNLPRGELRVALGDAGDVNADGYADIILGLQVDGAGSYFGPLPVLESDGWKSGPRNGRVILPDGTVVAKMIAGAGDVDGDGYDDALVGLYDPAVPGQTLLFLFHGSTDGLAGVPEVLWAEMTFGSLNDYYSESACGAGDVNGDGYADVLVGSPRFGAGEAGEGHVVIYLGGPGL